MSISSLSALALAALAAATVSSPRLGRPATPEELARADISVLQTGDTLPPGKGSVSQGKAIYEAKCQSCHGPEGANGPMDRLTGGVGSLATTTPIKTVSSFWPYATTVFDYVRRAMPLTAPQSLTNEEVYAVTAYILSVDNIVPKDAVLDARSLPLVRMPNRDGFVGYKGRANR